MMLPSHLGAALLLGLALSRFIPSWGGKEWILALGFGVVIDLDHLLNLPRFMLANPEKAFDVQAMVTWGAHWQGFMHTPWALLVVAGAAVLFRSWVPAVFWGLHMFQDFVVATRWVVFGSPTEWAIVGALYAALALLLLGDYLVTGRGTGFPGYVKERALLGLVAMRDAPRGRLVRVPVKVAPEPAATSEAPPLLQRRP